MAETMTLPNDPTLDEIRAYLAPHIAREAAFDGWTKEAVINAARAESFAAYGKHYAQHHSGNGKTIEQGGRP